MWEFIERLLARKAAEPAKPQLIKFEPGAKYILQTPCHLSQETIERLKADWERLQNDPKVHVIVLEENLKITKIGDAKAAHSHNPKAPSANTASER